MKKIILILIMCFSLIGLLQAQKYANNIQLQSITDTVTRPVPINTQITLIDSARLYLITASQPVGTSMANIIAAGEFKILSNDKVMLDSTYIKTVDLDDGTAYFDSIAANMPPLAITTDDTVKWSHHGQVMEISSETDIELMIPNNSTEPIPVGSTFNGTRDAAGEITITVETGVLLVSPGNKRRISEVNAPFTLYKSAANSWKLWGGLKE